MTWRRSQWGLAIGAAAILGAAFLSGGPQTGISLRPDTVVAELGGGLAVSAALRDAVQAQRTDPMNVAAATAAARLMIDEGRAKGDSRLVGAALAILAPHLRDQVLGAQYLAATARQYQHDFPGALVLLDAVLTADPLDVNARLSRATIRTVQGDYPAALEDCARISALRADVGFLCQATALTATRDAPRVAERLTAILGQAARLDTALILWARSLRAEIALLQGDTVTAEAQLRIVLGDDPMAQREQLMLADLLLARSRADEVETLLHASPDTDGVLIRRVLAARAQGADAPGLVTTLASRAQRSLDIGLVAHAREEAMFYLMIADDPGRALERALVNWDLQHEVDDAQLLILAAAAAGMPEAARPVLDWMQKNAIEIPAFVIPASVADLQDPAKL